MMEKQNDYRLIVDFWRFWADHLPPENTDEYFNRLVDNSDRFWHEHGDGQLVRDMLVALLREMERRAMS